MAVVAYQHRTQAELVTQLVAQGLVTSSRVEAALRELDRREFCATHIGIPDHVAYADMQIPIGQGQHISAPSMHAVCLELLEQHLAPGARALDVGTGSGYVAACMSLLVGPAGSVVALERQMRILDQARLAIAQGLAQRLSRHVSGAGRPQLSLERVFNVDLAHGNVLEDGVASGLGQFDAVHVGAAASEVAPALQSLLKPGGRMVLAVGGPRQMQLLTVVDKAADGTLSTTHSREVKMPPLAPANADKPWGW